MQNTDQPSNEQVIEKYFDTSGYDTKIQLQKFLFDMQANFVSSGEWMDEYRDQCFFNFKTLFDLVSGLNIVEDKIKTKVSLN